MRVVRGAGIGRWGLRLVLWGALAASAAPAWAEEGGGFFGFLASLGGASQPAPAAAPAAPAPGGTEGARPLIVRRGHRKPTDAHGGLGRPRMARLPGKTGPISIFEDPTLRSGDAVMTKDGMKVFAGGRLSPDHPFSPSDFVVVSASKAVAPNLRKTVNELNKLPHG